MTYSQHNAGEEPMGDVIEFQRPDSREIEHVSSSVFVERIPVTAELRAKFEAAGYTIEDEES